MLIACILFFYSLSLILLSVWNGSCYYVEVWGRRFERELDALKREIEATQHASAAVDEIAPITRSASTRDSEAEAEIEAMEEDKKDQ